LATKGDIESTATLYNGTLYFGGTDQRLYSLNPLTGDVKWNTLTGGPIVTSPAYFDGAVIWSAATGNSIRMFSPLLYTFSGVVVHPGVSGDQQ
jgi:outer membrane protein assembly factor BamB